MVEIGNSGLAQERGGKKEKKIVSFFINVLVFKLKAVQMDFQCKIALAYNSSKPNLNKIYGSLPTARQLK